jgi:uncharacterized protein YjcR
MEKEKLKKYCDLGLSSRVIADRVGVSQTTIRYWLDKYSLKTKGWFKYDEQELRKIVGESKSRNEVLTKLSRNNSSGAYKSLNRAFLKFNIDISHFRNQSEISKHTHKNKRLDNDEIFIENSKTSRAAIKKRIIDFNLLEYRCFKCGQDSLWKGENLVLILDHINGVNNDNRLKNLRFVCPNCNSQLVTHCRKK